MITAKEARAKTESEVNQALISAVLDNIETKIVLNAEVGNSTLDWTFGDNIKLGDAVRKRLVDLGYSTEISIKYGSLRISW